MLWEQFKKNFLAILSLAIATTSLIYATWRNEHSERNRNVRVAAFEVLKELGQLQTQVYYAYYEKDVQMGNPITGWGRVLLIKDLAMVIPPPVPQDTEILLKIWRENFQGITKDETSVQAVLGSIDQTRRSIIQVIHRLK